MLSTKLVLVGILICLPVWGGPCTMAPLTTYVGFSSTGCTFGSFTFKDFTFSVLGMSGGYTPLGAGGITVNPAAAPGMLALNFGGAFSVTGNESVDYLITYTVDPPPIIIHGWDLDLFTFTPVAPGLASITTDLCRTSAFSGAVCPAGAANTFSLNVFHDGTGGSVTSTGVGFAPTNVVGVRSSISLDGNGASADFASFTNTTDLIPEPSTFLLIAGGLCALGLLRRRRRF